MDTYSGPRGSMAIAQPPGTMHGGPRVPVWLDLTEDWPEGHPGDAEEEGEVCAQSSFILLRSSTTSESSDKLEARVTVCRLSLCSLFLSINPHSLALVRSSNPLPLCLVLPAHPLSDSLACLTPLLVSLWLCWTSDVQICLLPPDVTHTNNMHIQVQTHCLGYFWWRDPNGFLYSRYDVFDPRYWMPVSTLLSYGEKRKKRKGTEGSKREKPTLT